MPSNIVKLFAEKTGKTEQEVEELWNKAKNIAAEEGKAENYAYITGILKKMLKLNESFKDYLSTLDQVEEIHESLYELDTEDVMKSQVNISGIGIMSVEGLMKDIKEMLQELLQKTNNGPHGYRQINDLLEKKLLNLKLKSLIDAYNDLEKLSKRGGLKNKSIPKNTFRA